ncbi:hypothetical protein M271_38980 [Streptomyces rapamycinicus NRRL 5491]|nr:hypothetical protein M271_38980 [Streptomyces rapamycinicus NRRL 5491]
MGDAAEATESSHHLMEDERQQLGLAQGTDGRCRHAQPRCVRLHLLGPRVLFVHHWLPALPSGSHKHYIR